MGQPVMSAANGLGTLVGGGECYTGFGKCVCLFITRKSSTTNLEKLFKRRNGSTSNKGKAFMIRF